MLELTVNKQNGAIYFGGEFSFSLSKNECLILELLYSNSDKIISSGHIGKTCWPGRVVSPVSVPVAIKHIRDVLKKCFDQQLIITHKGEGYSFSKTNHVIKFISAHENCVQAKENDDELNKKSSKIKNNKLVISLCIVVTLLFFVIFDGNSYINSYYEPTKNIHVITNHPIKPPLNLDDKIKNSTLFYDDLGCKIICNQFKCIELK